ncbi:MAG: T9SS type A sorting domain-containing protein [Saprospiraceae bacterium]
MPNLEDYNYISDFSFYNDQIGIVSSGAKLYTTVDGANTLTALPNTFATAFVQMITNQQFVWASVNGNGTRIMETKDFGQTNTQIMNFCPESTSMFYNDNTLWLGQKAGHINKVLLNDLPSSNNDSNYETRFTIAPNPVLSGRSIKIKCDYDGILKVKIYNILGGMIYKNDNYKSHQDILINQDVGLYYTSIEYGNIRMTEKIIIQ